MTPRIDGTHGPAKCPVVSGKTSVRFRSLFGIFEKYFASAWMPSAPFSSVASEG